MHDRIRSITSIIAIVLSVIALCLSWLGYANGKKTTATTVIQTFHTRNPARGKLALDHLATLEDLQLRKSANKESYVLTQPEQMASLKRYLPDAEEAYLAQVPVTVREDHAFQVSTDAFNTLNAFELALQPWAEGLADTKMIRAEFEVTLEQWPNLRHLIQRLRAARGNEASDAWSNIDKFLDQYKN